MKLILLVLFVLFTNANCIADDGAKTVEKIFSVPPLSMTYDDAAFILNHIHKLIETANAGYKVQTGRVEEVKTSISAGEDTVSLTGWYQLTEVQGLPKVARSFRFDYSLFQAPISSVELILWDGYRKISIKGQDEAQVQAIASSLRESMQKHENYFGGAGFRIFGAIILVIIALVLTNFRNLNTGKPMWPPVLAGVFLLSAIYFSPWDLWLPGVAIYSGTASFIDRNINLLSFIGLILTFVIYPVAKLFRNLRERSEES